MVIAMQEDWYSSLGYDHLWCTASRTRNVVPNIYIFFFNFYLEGRGEV